MMLPLFLFSVLIGLSHARPSVFGDVPRPNFFMGIDSYIIGGLDADPGEFPWQLAQQRLSGSTWSHSCGATILSSIYGLIAANCIDGANAGNLRVIAGLHDQTDTSLAQISNIASYKIHEQYANGFASFANDIAILTFETEIVLEGNVAAALLPVDNEHQYAGVTCQISGWGRTGLPNTLSDILQKATIEVISTDECISLMAAEDDEVIWENHICLYDSLNDVGSCTGDYGGPLNCPDGGIRVAGISSWVVTSGVGRCLQTYPSVYTRTASYLDWISANTP